jgi:hypothetical protein
MPQSRMQMDNEAICRKRAKEAAEIAEKMPTSQDRAAWLKVAVEWLKLAEAAQAKKKK